MLLKGLSGLTTEINETTPISKNPNSFLDEINIVIADDEHAIVENLAETILANLPKNQEIKVNIHKAYDGEQALDLIEKTFADLVLLDVNMPFMNGYEVFNTLRKDPDYQDHSNTPIIFITGESEETIKKIAEHEQYRDIILQKNKYDKTFLSYLIHKELGYIANEKIKQQDQEKNNLIVEDLEKSRKELLLYFSSSHTSAHNMRVKVVTQTIAESPVLNLTKDEKNILKQMVIDHDKGKFAIPKTILEKKGTLTEEEYHIMQSHVIISSIMAIIESIDVFSASGHGDKYHHKKYSGGGYASTEALLQKDTIELTINNKKTKIRLNLLLSIIALADSFDAMTSIRSYKTKISLKEVTAEIIKSTYTDFHPLVTEAFFERFTQIHKDFSQSNIENKAINILRNSYNIIFNKLNNSNLFEKINNYIKQDIEEKDINQTSKRIEFKKYVLQQIVEPFYSERLLSKKRLSFQQLKESYQKKALNFLENQEELSIYQFYSDYSELGWAYRLINFKELQKIKNNILKNLPEEHLNNIKINGDIQELLLFWETIFYKESQDINNPDQELIHQEYLELTALRKKVKNIAKNNLKHSDKKIRQTMEYFNKLLEETSLKIKKMNQNQENYDFNVDIDNILSRTERYWNDIINEREQ